MSKTLVPALFLLFSSNLQNLLVWKSSYAPYADSPRDLEIAARQRWALASVVKAALVAAPFAALVAALAAVPFAVLVAALAAALARYTRSNFQVVPRRYYYKYTG